MSGLTKLKSASARLITLVQRRAHNTLKSSDGKKAGAVTLSEESTVKPKVAGSENHATGGFYKKNDGSEDVYLNPLLSPPPRSPKTPEDFSDPQKLGHWNPLGFDWTNPIADQYKMHEAIFLFFLSSTLGIYIWLYGPDYKLKDWCVREAFLRTHRREALGQPLIEINYIDPERIVLPSEEELKDSPFEIII